MGMRVGHGTSLKERDSHEPSSTICSHRDPHPCTDGEHQSSCSQTWGSVSTISMSFQSSCTGLVLYSLKRYWYLSSSIQMSTVEGCRVLWAASSISTSSVTGTESRLFSPFPAFVRQRYRKKRRTVPTVIFCDPSNFLEVTFSSSCRSKAK